MFEIRVEKTFASAHKLRGYKGRCENLHGHNWKIEVIIASKKLNRLGLVYDFTDVKKDLAAALAKYDHCFLNELAPFDKINPSSENIAKTIYDLMAKKYPVKKVICWESENSCAAYRK